MESMDMEAAVMELDNTSNLSSWDAGNRADSVSPFIPAEDVAFNEKHNFLASCYQYFKSTVESFVARQESNFVPQIIQSAENLYMAAEDEKRYLGEILCNWAMRQQKVSIGSLWDQEVVYKELDAIDIKYEVFGEYLDQTLTAMCHLMDNYCSQLPGLDIVFKKLHSLTHLFLYYSVIVSRQPPAVVVKCGEAENHRRSRFWFNTELRLLGGRCFGLTDGTSECSCYLVTDDTTRQLRKDAYFQVTESEEFALEPQLGKFGKGQNDSYLAKFEDARISKKSQIRRDGVASRRYSLCYSINLSVASHNIQLIGKKISLPFAILVGPKNDVEARLFLERSFADLVRNPLSDIPSAVPYMEMAEALEMKFQALVETAHKSADKPQLLRPRSLGQNCLRHLVSRLKPRPDSGQLSLDNFLKLQVAEEFSVGKKGSMEGEWKLVTFYDWFFKLAEIVNKFLFSLWFQGLIYGFCGKQEAERLLNTCPRLALLIRFSDLEFGKIKISVKHTSGTIKHHWYEWTDLQARDLRKELLTNHNFQGIELIYPDKRLHAALVSAGTNAKPKSKSQPRILVSSDNSYFENQDAATSAAY